MATHLWDLPPLTPPTERAAPPDAQKEKVPSPEQRPGSAADSLGAMPTQSDAILDGMSKPRDAAPTGPEEARSKAGIPSPVRRAEGPEPAPVEYRQPQQEPRAMGRHRLLWEVVGAETNRPGMWHPEFEAVEHPIEQSRQPAPHAVTERPSQGVVKELDGAASNLVEQTRRRLEGEARAALDTFRREVDARLHALEEEHLSQWVAKLQAEMTEQTQRQIDNLGEGRHPSLEWVSEQLHGRVKEELDVAASGLLEQTRGRMQSEVAAALETFRREVSACLHALEQEPSIAKLRAEITAQAQKELGHVRDAAREAHQDLRQSADAAVEKTDLAVETAAGKLRTFEHQTEVRLADAVDSLRKTSDDLVASSARRVEGQVVATGERVTEELRALQTRLVGEVDKQLGAAIQAPLESLTRKAEAITEESRRRLRQELEEGVRKSVLELEADSRTFLEKQRESVQRLWDERLATAIQKSRESLKQESQAIMVECRDHLLQEVDAAVAASAPKREAEREKLPTKPREPGMRPMEVYLAGPPELRQESTQFHEVLLRPRRDGTTRLRAFLHAAFRAAVWLIPIVPILLFLILSIRPAMHLRADPPAEFFEGPPDSNATQPTAEERLARAYWDSAVQYVQPKYEFGMNLPDEPVPEFKVEETGARRGSSKSYSETRRRYWRRLRQVWVLPQTWQKSYVWDTGWVDAALTTVQRASKQLVDGGRSTERPR